MTRGSIATMDAAAEREARRRTAVVRDHFGEASAEWADRYRRAPRSMADLDLRLRRENTQRLLREIVSWMDRRATVLDVGCGTADVLDGFPRESLRVFGIDLATPMVAAAARTHPADRFAAADAASLPFAPASIDIATCMGVLEYVPAPTTVLDSLAAVIRPGGSLLVSFPNGSSLFRRLLAVERAAERAVVRLRNPWRGAAASVEGYRHAKWTIRSAKELLARSGFEAERVIVQTFGPWGRLGRLRPCIDLSDRLSRRFARPSAASACLAATIVIQARNMLSVS